MKMSKFGYFAEFLLFPPLILVAALLAFHRSIQRHLVECLIVFALGIWGWTLVEYILHRLLFHHAPVLSVIHSRHHYEPQELIGTPAWASAVIGLFAVACPLWAILGLGLGIAERLIGSIRRECLDHIVVLGEAHLGRILQAYAAYYNDIRTHWSLDKDAPTYRAAQWTGDIKSDAILGGMHHHYVRV